MTHLSRVDDSLESGAVACWGGAGRARMESRRRASLDFYDK